MMDEKEIKQLQKRYGKSKKGNFTIKDIVPVKGHYFCITPKHIEYASNHCSGMLNEESMSNAPCGICHDDYDKHENAVLIECKKDPKDGKECQSFLLSIREKVEEDGYVGFAFMEAK